MRRKARTIRRWTLVVLGPCLVVVAGLFLTRPLLVEYRLGQARRALAERDAEEALVWLGRAERLDPHHGATHFWMARAYRRLGRPGEMQAHLLRALELGHPPEALKREELLSLTEAGQVPPNDPRLSAMMLDPGNDSLEIYEAVVRGHLENFHVGPALMMIDAWERDYPEDPQACFYRGLIRTHQSQWPEAVAAFRQALRLAPRRYDVRLHLAPALREDYQYREALAHYLRCIDSEEHPEALFGWGKCLEALGESEQAREVYLRLLAKVPDHYEGNLALGKLDLSFGDAKEALPRLERAAKQRPYEVDVRHNLAWALAYTGEKERAREHFQFAVRAQESAMRVKNLSARVDAEPENVDLRFEIGAILMQYGQLSTALAWFHSALQLDPRHRPTHLALADYYAQRGNPGLAAEHRRLADGAE